MSTSDRVANAVGEHRAFESTGELIFNSTTTTFDAVVDATVTDNSVSLAVTVTVPMLSAVTDDDLAPIVEDGWYETFERRVTDLGAIFRTDRELTPQLTRDDGEAVVTATLTDRNIDRGVDDAAALIDFVEGTYVQGVIPGYTYTDPVAGLLEQ
ncbi:MAG: hypothetical protein J07HN4v3_03033, partial [Halonotius sp. J07HN4]